MMSAFKKLFSQTPEPAIIEDYVAWRRAHPAEADVLASENPRFRHLHCHVHDTALVTTVGYRTRMDCLPSNAFMEAAAHHPFCLDVGEKLTVFNASNPARLLFCPACEEGMKSR